jgi:hypothetical protein
LIAFWEKERMPDLLFAEPFDLKNDTTASGTITCSYDFRGQIECLRQNPGGAMQTLEDKTAHLEEVRKRVEAYVASGGDLKSREAVPLGIDFVKAFDAVASEFGYSIRESINRHPD